MDQGRAALVRAFADLAGRPVSDLEVRAVIERADAMTNQEANTLWRRQQRAPHTVAFREYLAMTLRFLD